MSEYLIAQLHSTRNVDIVYNASVVGGQSVEDSLSGVEIAQAPSGSTEVVPAAGLFVLIGSSPHTQWLAGTVQLDETGFVAVGADVDRTPARGSRADATAARDQRAGCLRRR